jgi:hypothetical protein
MTVRSPPNGHFELSARAANDRDMGVADSLRDIDDLQQSNARRLLLLVHGFNNSREVARESFDEFSGLVRIALGESRLKPDAVVHFQWPGDMNVVPGGLLDFAGYPWDINRARESAALLAQFLWGVNHVPGFELIIVGHSLGCRLILEMLQHPAARQAHAGPPARVAYLGMMAAAVPVAKVEGGGPLYSPDIANADIVKFHSSHDMVLALAFPAGQGAAWLLDIEDDWYVRPIGRYGAPDNFGTSSQTQNGHSDYWKDASVARQVALRLDPTLPHALETRSMPAQTLNEAQLPRKRVYSKYALPQ